MSSQNQTPFPPPPFYYCQPGSGAVRKLRKQVGVLSWSFSKHAYLRYLRCQKYVKICLRNSKMTPTALAMEKFKNT